MHALLIRERNPVLSKQTFFLALHTAALKANPMTLTSYLFYLDISLFLNHVQTETEHTAAPFLKKLPASLWTLSFGSCQ